MLLNSSILVGGENNDDDGYNDDDVPKRARLMRKRMEDVTRELRLLPVTSTGGAMGSNDENGNIKGKQQSSSSFWLPHPTRLRPLAAELCLRAATSAMAYADRYRRRSHCHQKSMSMLSSSSFQRSDLIDIIDTEGISDAENDAYNASLELLSTLYGRLELDLVYGALQTPIIVRKFNNADDDENENYDNNLHENSRRDVVDQESKCRSSLSPSSSSYAVIDVLSCITLQDDLLNSQEQYSWKNDRQETAQNNNLQPQPNSNSDGKFSC
eukprot:15358209-Ditylum_brightwellii.AAC.1